MPSLPRILIAQDDPHSCCAPNVNTDSPIHHGAPFCSTRPKYSDDLVPAAGTALRFSKTAVLKNEEVEMERRQGYREGRTHFRFLRRGKKRNKGELLQQITFLL